MIELYKNIKELRIEKGMTQEELAKKVGYTDRSSIAKIEKGEVDLLQSKLLLIADALNVTASELMGDEGVVSDSDRLLHKFNRLNNNGKSQLMDYADFLLSKDELKKEGIEEKEMCS